MKLPDGAKRILRKSVTNAGGLAGATRKAVASVPAAVLESAIEVFTPSTDQDTRSRRLRLVKLGSSLALATTVGGLIAGPAGAIVGLAGSFVQATLANVTESIAGDSQRFQGDVRSRVQESLESPESPTLGEKLKAVVHGTMEGVKSEFHHGRISGSARAAGFLDGLDYDPRLPNLNLPEAPKRSLGKKLLVNGLKAGMGAIGAILSLPGGLIVGSLEAIKGPDQDFTPNMKPLLRLSSGLGKALIPGVLGGIFAGPAGAAVATGAGLLFDIAVDGINTISDGRQGVNDSMHEAIHDSLSENLSEEEKNSGYGVYYRAGKGAAVGAQVSLAEGWKRGYYGGVEALKALLESPFQAAPTTDGPEPG